VDDQPLSNGHYSLVNDQPVKVSQHDLLGTGPIASGIASMIVASRRASPLVLAIDASWGMGKSTVLHQIEADLKKSPGIITEQFNAWTADSEHTLEGLIKSVLVRLDKNVVRRGVRKLAKRKRVMGLAKFAAAITARLLGVSRLVDEIWSQLSVDAKSGNELRGLIHGMLSDWVKADGKRAEDRLLVVFIDDLDRCSDDVVVKVCEAVKLYLDAPGLIFVMCCDQAVLARGVSGMARGGSGEGRTYLEKIVQVAYRLPLPEVAQVRKLIAGCAERSGTTALIDDTVAGILAERTGRNPRKIKRIINSFVLEHHLDPEWRRPPLGSPQLVIAILLQQLYSTFYDMLVREDSSGDLISELLDYSEVRAGLPTPPAADDDPWWVTVRRSFDAHRIQVPQAPAELRGMLETGFERLEKEVPEEFSDWVRNGTFIALLRGLGNTNTRRALRAKLISSPLATELPQPQDIESPGTVGRPTVQDGLPRFSGLRFVSVDDNPASTDVLVSGLEARGAAVKRYSDSGRATAEITQWPPDAVISDITRGNDRDAGFTFVEELRRKGYDGPVVFFTGRVTVQRRERAEKLKAFVVADEYSVMDALSRAL
jgi:CheY-like chemotaxis protein